MTERTPKLQKARITRASYFVANCTDEDGEMVAYKWLVDGEREVTGRKISFVKAGRESVHVSLKGFDDSGDSSEAETSVAM